MKADTYIKTGRKNFTSLLKKYKIEKKESIYVFKGIRD
jgi:hypothetical protein